MPGTRIIQIGVLAGILGLVVFCFRLAFQQGQTRTPAAMALQATTQRTQKELHDLQLQQHLAQMRHDASRKKFFADVALGMGITLLCGVELYLLILLFLTLPRQKEKNAHVLSQQDTQQLTQIVETWLTRYIQKREFPHE